MPVDQFSFREDGNDGMINVLLRAEGGGDAMGGPEVAGGGIALLRVPIVSLGDGSRAAPESAYTRLPSPGGEAWNFHNRFVGDHVLYGTGGKLGFPMGNAVGAMHIERGWQADTRFSFYDETPHELRLDLAS